MFLTVEMRSGGRPAESAHRGMRRSSASSPARGGVCVCVAAFSCVICSVALEQNNIQAA